MTTLASLPMYDAPTEAREAFWRGLRRRLIAAGFEDAPEALSEPDDLDAHWRAPDLLLSQTCGRPFATTLQSAVTPLATPHYDAPGCDGPLYRSVFIVRSDDPAQTFADLRGRRAAYNGRDSHSGFSRLFEAASALAPDGAFFGEAIHTGAHRRSMALVADDGADVAAIDCVTCALAAQERPETVARLKTLAWSPPSPGLPLVTAASRSADEIERLRSALAAAFADPALAAACAALRFTGLSVLPATVYAPLRDVAAVADAAFERQN